MTPKRVLICTNRTCRKQGSQKVLAAFQSLPIPDVTIESSSCLGQCGNGPMVLILPDEIWYSQVQPDEVRAVVERHLQRGIPVKGMLYPKFHPQ
ncbi:(2Fe-2S) ferredoxin domain-containing protein [Oscillatoria acuminata]|uniref:Ferredoxin n=1 Tax=Oscillatoria acuminata PCC 6304 TaxID=56110 RepID=K9TH82_9CYAN|nr:(2Fe-2S) ferredoxin domain-containing protein [Oscillatoria acuminata]AFY81501.1 ferredoxin [Oscillatoria acuminata PCC 6304]